MPNYKTIFQHYKDYMENHELLDSDRMMLFHFCHEIMGCVNLTWKEKSLKGGTFSKEVTTSDEAFAYFIMRDYDKITTKEDRKQKTGRLATESCDAIFWGNDAGNPTIKEGTLGMDRTVR